jgi:hypothetical protein
LLVLPAGEETGDDGGMKDGGDIIVGSTNKPPAWLS